MSNVDHAHDREETKDKDPTKKINYDFEVAVIGSGFGGSIAAIELAKVFKKLNPQNPLEVLILERGIWYTSPEAYLDPENKVTKFIKREKRPYRFWVMPDNSKASLNLLAMLRSFPMGSGIWGSITNFILNSRGKRVNPMALYDVKNFNESFALVASGVGGGSLVYSNVTIAPEPEILDLEYKECDRNNPLAANPNDVWKPAWKIGYDDLEPYMMYAKHKFIEVSKIYSVEAGYKNKQMWLPKTKELHDAVEQLPPNEYKATFELADLSITGAPSWDSEKQEYTKTSTKFCRRQGRCNFGCLPGARHSLNKKLVDAIEGDDEKEGLPIRIYERSEVLVIEPISDGDNGYRIYYKDWKDEKEKKISVKTLILAAGTFGTTGLILRSKKNYPEDPKRTETFENVSNEVGTCFSLNGDTFGFVIDTKNLVYPTRGPIDTAHVRFKKNKKHLFTIEDATIPRIVAGTFAAGIQRHLGDYSHLSEHEDLKIVESAALKPHLGRKFFLSWSIHPAVGYAVEYILRNNSDVTKFLKAIIRRFFTSLSNRKWGEVQFGSNSWLPGTKEHPTDDHGHRALDELEVDYLVSRVFFFACMGIDSANGKATEWDPKRERFDVNWGDLANDPIYREIKHGMEMLGEVMVNPNKKGEKEKYIILDPMKQLFAQQVKSKNGEWLSKMFSLHPLGGCPMETNGRTGAVAIDGSLLKNDGHNSYSNLYIVDGSIIPTALGVNPSLTISGLAFKIIDGVIRKYRPEGPIVNSVEKDVEYTVTFREISKRGPETYTVATVDPVYIDENGEKKKKTWDNIVYVNGCHLQKDAVYSGQECKGKVLIMKVENRVAYGKLVA